MMTESPEPEGPEANPSSITRPGLTPPQPRPTTGDMHTRPDNNASGESPSPGTVAARDREAMPPPPPTPLQSGGPLELEGLQRAYDVYHGTSPHDLVGALQGHFQGVHQDRRFTVALLPHGATNICVRQLHKLPSLGQRTPDDLIDERIWWFNHQQPKQGRIWVPHLAWAHTLIAAPTRPRPATSPGGRARATLQLNAHVLDITPHNRRAS